MRAVVGAGVVLRIVATLGVTPTVYVDSAEYRGIALFGGRRRPWTVPALHAVVGDGVARVLAHAVLGAAAWAALALAVAAALEHRVVRVVAAAAVMGTGLTTTVTNYDATITSETVAVSLTALLIAAWLRLAVTPKTGWAVALLVIAVLFAFTRNDLPWLLLVAAVPAVVAAVRTSARAWTAVVAGLLLVSAWGILAASRNDEIERFNLAMVVANRIVPDAAYLEWFTDDGMPLPSGVRPVVGLAGGDTTLAFADDPAWNRWAGDAGRTTYVRFLLAHPRHLLLEPWPDVLGVRSTTLEQAKTPTVLLSPGDAYGRVHQVLPAPVESLLWGPGDAGSVVVAVAGLTAYAIPRLRRPRRLAARLGPARLVAAGALAVGVGHLVVVWHASPIELNRLAMVPATVVHVSVLILVAVTIDRRLTPTTREPGAVASSMGA